MMSHEECVVWCSNHYLTVALPDNWNELSDEEVVVHVGENLWEPFEYHPATQVLELILEMAYSLELLLKEKQCQTQ